MANLLEQAIDCDDGDNAVQIIRDALGIESDEVKLRLSKNVAGRSQATRSHDRRMAPGGSSSPSRALACAGMTGNWSDEETDEPLIADHRKLRR
jgi:hypothetical protein